MTDVLNVKIRDRVGTNAARKVRKSGGIPAILYGHGDDNVSLAVPVEELRAAMRHGSQLVELQGDVRQTALIREVQWDTFGMDVLHVDFARVSAGERVEVTVPLELRGEAPGAKEGGIVEQVAHAVQIQCPASSIPEKIEIRINALGLSSAIKMGEIPLPEDFELLSDADETVVHCSAAVEVAEEEEVAAPAEPEVIGRPAADDETGD